MVCTDVSDTICGQECSNWPKNTERTKSSTNHDRILDQKILAALPTGSWPSESIGRRITAKLYDLVSVNQER